MQRPYPSEKHTVNTLCVILCNAGSVYEAGIHNFLSSVLFYNFICPFNVPFLTQKSASKTPFWTSFSPQNTGYSIAIAAGSACELQQCPKAERYKILCLFSFSRMELPSFHIAYNFCGFSVHFSHFFPIVLLLCYQYFCVTEGTCRASQGSAFRHTLCLAGECLQASAGAQVLTYYYSYTYIMKKSR